MAWTTPRLWTAGELVTASMMNTHVRDNLAYLKGSAGAVTFDSGLSVTGAVAASGAISGTTGTFSSTGSFAGRTTFSDPEASAMASASGSLGSVEVAPSSGAGMSAIAFHRPGAYAVYFGLDTDSVLKVGGWSMGAVAYPIATTTQAQTLSNKTLTDPKWTGGTAFAVANANDLTNYMFNWTNTTATLPSASGRAGQIRFIKCWGVTSITVNSASANLAGPGSTAMVSSFTIVNGESVLMVCDGTYWWTI